MHSCGFGQGTEVKLPPEPGERSNGSAVTGASSPCGCQQAFSWLSAPRTHVCLQVCVRGPENQLLK